MVLLWPFSFLRIISIVIHFYESFRKKLLVKYQQLEESLQAAQSKAHGLEKLKSRLAGEVDDLTGNIEDVSFHINYDIYYI